MDETTDFKTLNAWYQEASNRLETSEMVLLIYHHLVVLFDADEVRSRQPQPNADHVPYEKRSDTEKTIYRHNHMSDGIWDDLDPSTQAAWSREMARRTGKSVVTS